MEQSIKKSNPLKIIIPIIAVIVCIAIAITVYFVGFYEAHHSSPKAALASCLLKLPEQFNLEELGYDELEDIDLVDFLQTISQEGFDSNLTLTLEDTNISTLSYGVGAEGILSFSQNKPKKLLNAGLGVYLYGMGGDVQLFATPDTFMANSESFLPDDYLMADIEKLQELPTIANTPLDAILEEYQKSYEPSKDILTILKDLTKELTTHWNLTGSCKETTIDIHEKSYATYIYDAVSDLDTRPNIRFYLTPDEQLLGLDITFKEQGQSTVSLRLGGKHPGQEIYVTGQSPYGDFDLALTGNKTSGDAIYTLNLSANHNGQNHMNATISFTLSTEDEEICANFDSIHLSAEKDTNTYYVDCSGKATLSAGCKDLVTPSGNAYDILSMTTDDFNQLKETMTENSSILFLLELLPDDSFENFFTENFR